MAKCRACGKEIRWIKTLTGKAMPVDLNPVLYWAVAGGASRIVTPEGKTLACALKGDLRDVTGLGYVPHWATCAEQQACKKAKTSAKASAEQKSLF